MDSASQFAQVCQSVARLGGEQLLQYRTRFQTSSKGPNDLVTDADFASQKAIHDALQSQYPAHRFLGEESIELSMCDNKDSEFCWIVDPLDGTLNYVHGLQSYSVSVALRFQQEIIAAAVFDPWLDEMYSAARGIGASLNGSRIKVSECSELNAALSVISLPSNISPESPELAQFLNLLYQSRSIRRLGSAALNLCYVACGRVDLYWATTVNNWDIAAGYLILEEAGGTMLDVSGKALDIDRPRFVASCNERVNMQARQALAST